MLLLVGNFWRKIFNSTLLGLSWGCDTTILMIENTLILTCIVTHKNSTFLSSGKVKLYCLDQIVFVVEVPEIIWGCSKDYMVCKPILVSA